jgi:trans-aconitate methyltransferase
VTLIEEYENQNRWREWERYLNKLPLHSEQTIYDLGCSIGFVSNLFAARVKKVVGFDEDRSLLEEARKQARA